MSNINMQVVRAPVSLTKMTQTKGWTPCTAQWHTHRFEGLQLPDSYQSLSSLHSASHYFLSKGMLVEAMTAAATLVGICLTDKLM